MKIFNNGALPYLFASRLFFSSYLGGHCHCTVFIFSLILIKKLGLFIFLVIQQLLPSYFKLSCEFRSSCPKLSGRAGSTQNSLLHYKSGLATRIFSQHLGSILKSSSGSIHSKDVFSQEAQSNNFKLINCAFLTIFILVFIKFKSFKQSFNFFSQFVCLRN